MGEVEKITPVSKYLKVMLGKGFEESRSSNQFRASGGFQSRTDSSVGFVLFFVKVDR
jgi:hypothetical protein